jgi:hypothetical protein
LRLASCCSDNRSALREVRALMIESTNAIHAAVALATVDNVDASHVKALVLF